MYQTRCSISGATTGCLKNIDIGIRKENIYYCHDPDKQECCEMEGIFTCCESNHDKNVYDFYCNISLK